ncbi:MAG: gephyrin-like molybdotransferase Glp [Bacteroidales bacterium]|nr:gephyrin-like molybdotransferase Glp [Bacteroidales bacterium]
MTNINDLLNKVHWKNFTADTETVELEKTPGRVLRENVVADMQMPPFDKSAMDGYACRRQDLDKKLEVLEVIQAGMLPEKTIGAGQCAKIMTGAAVPAGADCVFMIEYAGETTTGKVRFTGTNTKNNICYRGEDYTAGNVLIKKNIVIKPAHVGIMASAGYSRVKVSPKPRIAIIATGTELIESSGKPGPGQIRNSNSPQIAALLSQMGIQSHYSGIVADDEKAITEHFQEAIEKNDVVIISGGASEGDYDFVAEVLKKHDFTLLASKTGMKPGNPMIFGQQGDKFCFGLSGNPVSSFVQFTYFVKPFLYRWMHCSWQPLMVKGRLSRKYTRKKTERFAVIPVLINQDNVVEQINFHGSAHINALAGANAFMEVPQGTSSIAEGGEVYVRPF